MAERFSLIRSQIITNAWRLVPLIETIDSCIRETALTLVDATAIHSVADIGRENKT